ncbi:MAG: hypothetical protein ACRCYU_23490 [Nocardioides sp.]
MRDHPSDHLAVYAAESAALEPTEWEGWIADVEDLLDHSADGDLAKDGFSLDTFFTMFENGLSPFRASRIIVGAIYLDDEEGAIYRCVGLPGFGHFKMQMRDGKTLNVGSPPDHAEPVWRPRPERLDR